MSCSQCAGIEELFDEETVRKELAAYQRNGPDRTTRLLIDALKASGVAGKSLLDIGGGVGAIQHELLAAGALSAVDVDASSAYLSAAQKEAGRRSLADRIRFLHGDFVDLAESVAPADIVTLNRVICCYHDMVNLVDRSLGRARALYGVVFPRDTWLTRLAMVALNFVFKIQRNPYRSFIHSTRKVEELIERHHFQRIFYRQTLFWQVSVYAR